MRHLLGRRTPGAMACVAPHPRVPPDHSRRILSGMNATVKSIASLLRDHGLLARGPQSVDAASVSLTGADCDSRFAGPDHLFVCKGAAFKPAYLEQALEAGCVAYLCDDSRADELAAVAPHVSALVVRDDGLRTAMALSSAACWGHPDNKLEVVGITGTKGKSTTAYMLRAILDACHDTPQSAIMGSIDTFDGIEDAESVNTTPEPPDLWRHVANAAQSGLPYLTMEVSSQALKYERVVGLGLDVACFLNIGRDHISPREHPSFEDYFASKLRIFEQARVAVVNLGSDHADEVLAAAGRCKHVVTFLADGDAAGSDADVWCRDPRPSDSGIRLFVHTPSWEGEVEVGMAGLFNAENALCAIAACEVLGIGQEQVKAGLAHVRVPGRMELLRTSDPHITGIVDYAHNKLSYQRFFASVAKEYPGREVIAVFGAPGGKAYERRRELPEEASRWADFVVYTEEDPAHDPVEEICAQMAAATPEGQDFEVIVNRPRAIGRAVERAFQSPRGAVVCLLAKGDETRQHEGDSFVPCETDATLFERAVAARTARTDRG